jgi:hypothetical protein
VVTFNAPTSRNRHERAPFERMDTSTRELKG